MRCFLHTHQLWTSPIDRSTYQAWFIKSDGCFRRLCWGFAVPFSSVGLTVVVVSLLCAFVTCCCCVVFASVLSLDKLASPRGEIFLGATSSRFPRCTLSLSPQMWFCIRSNLFELPIDADCLRITYALNRWAPQVCMLVLVQLVMLRNRPIVGIAFQMYVRGKWYVFAIPRTT